MRFTFHPKRGLTEIKGAGLLPAPLIFFKALLIRISIIKAPIVIASIIFASGLISEVYAEVPVVDLGDGTDVIPARPWPTAGEAEPAAEDPKVYQPASPQPVSKPPANSSVASEPVAPSAQMFMQVQALQEELALLRGQVEELNHQIKVLKQQRLDDYVDLDKRIAALQGGAIQNGAIPAAGSNPVAVASPNTVTTGSATSPATTQANGSEKDSYSQAYNLLKQRKVEPAIAAFKQHIASYPDGEFTPNAYYWLGEIYLLQEQLSEAEQMFNALLTQFPGNRKVADAKFKLGKVYHQQGKDAQAKQLVEEVASGSSQTAGLAKSYLESNF